MMFFLPFLAIDIVNSEYVVGGEFEYSSETRTCHIIEFYANYKPLQLELTSLNNIHYFLVSDKHIESCNGGCPKDALYCSYTDSANLLEQISVCTEKIYIHTFPKIAGDELKAKVKTNYLSDVPCNDINRNPTNFCQLLPANECAETCNSPCGLLTCQKKRSISNQDLFTICMPEATPDEELKSRCDMHHDSNDYNWKVCKDIEGSMISLLLIVLAFGGLVVYYQRVYQKYGIPPFRVPRCCPIRLFPRRSEEEAENFRVIQ